MCPLVQGRTLALGQEGLLFQLATELIGVHGRPEEPALTTSTAHLDQGSTLRLCLNALGDHFEPEPMPEVEDRLDDRAVIGRNAGDERTVDLQNVDRKATKIAQRAEPRAEVVDGDMYAEGREPFEPTHRLLEVDHECRLGDFETQLRRIDTDPGDGASDPLHDEGLVELTGRQVDPHDEAGQVGVGVPFGAGSSGDRHHSFTDALDLAGGLGEFDEVARRNQATFLVVPAHERFGPEDLSGDQVDLGLEVDLELIVGHRPAELGLVLAALGHLEPRGIVEDLVPIPAFGLRPVERNLCVANEIVGLVTLAGKRDTGAGSSEDFESTQSDRAIERFEHTVGERHDLEHGRTARNDHCELVAAEATHHIGRTDRKAQSIGDLTQRIITDRMPVGIVEDPEPIHVDHHHCGTVAGERSLELTEEALPVGQACEFVMRGAVATVKPVAPLRGDINDLLEGAVVDHATPDDAAVEAPERLHSRFLFFSGKLHSFEIGADQLIRRSCPEEREVRAVGFLQHTVLVSKPQRQREIVHRSGNHIGQHPGTQVQLHRNPSVVPVGRHRWGLRHRYGATMRIRVLVALVAVIGAACAPGPSFEGLDETEPTTSTTTTTTVATAPPSTSEAPNDLPEADVDPASLGPVDGTIAAVGSTATLRSGTSTIDLTTGDGPVQPTWSRDGSRLALVSFTGRLSTVSIIDGATGDVLTESPAARPYFFFSWSHDGTRIAALGPGDSTTVLDILDGDGALLHRNVAEAGSLFVGWDPEEPRLAAHADDQLLRVNADGTTSPLGTVGADFYAPKWINGSRDMLLVVDLEGTSTLVRRSLDDGASMTTLGAVEQEVGISVDPLRDRAAITMLFEEGGAAGADRTSTQQQALAPQTGTLEIVDLLTAERTLIHEDVVLWAEWNPSGTMLLYSVHPGGSDTAQWWIYDGTTTYRVLDFVPATAFYQTHMVFADQYVEQPRLWSPDGEMFVFPEQGPSGPVVWTAPAMPDATPTLVGTGGLASWSLAPPPR